MRNSLGRKIILAIAMLGGYGMVQADVTPVPTAAANSDAVQFGVQAGGIAGTTQACGQDISLFVSRINEAINKLATSPGDKVMAAAAFQQALQQAQTQETNNHTIPCSQVVQDYSSLPILRPDYEQTVIAQLHPGMPAASGTAGSTSSASTPTTTPQTNTSASSQNGPSAQNPSSAAMSANSAVPATGPIAQSGPAMSPNTMNSNNPGSTNMPGQPAPANLQPGPQSGAMPSMPSNSTTPPPAAGNYNQSALPGAEQQQMVTGNAPANAATPPTATVPPPPPVTTVPPQNPPPANVGQPVSPYNNQTDD